MQRAVVRPSVVALFLMSILSPAPCALAQNGDAALDNWPQWRGPLGNGIAPSGDPPLRFSESENVKWKVDVPGLGYGTPIVWGDRIYLTTSIGPIEPRRPTSSQALTLLCYDRATGRELWRRTAREVVPHEGYSHNLSSYANQSAATDGERVYLFFGSRGAYAYTMDGEKVWERDFGVQMRMYNTFGESASPAVGRDNVVLLFDQEDASFIAAVNKRTGEPVWRRDREEPTSWTTPTIAQVGGREQAIVNAGTIVAYDTATGETVWTCTANPGDHPTPSPTVAGDLVYVATGTSRGRRNFRAIRLGGSGEISESDAMVWAQDRGTPYIPSPLIHDGLLYLVRDGGLTPGSNLISAFDALTGEPRYHQIRLPDPTWEIKASPVAAGDRIYMNTEQGAVLVFKTGPEFELLAVNQLDDVFLASPVALGGELFLRGKENLYCIGEMKTVDPE
jgi:outer membrane protein assembly factor BamB